MYRLLETIKVKEGKAYNLDLHNARFNKSRLELFHCQQKLDLRDLLIIPEKCNTGLWRCRILYNDELFSIDFIPYAKRDISSLKIIVCDNIEYSYKYEERNRFAELMKLKEGCNEICIVKENKITDTSFSNIVFYDGIEWITPANPLLKGTKRELLIQDETIREKNIILSDLKNYTYASLINAMLDLGETIIDIKNIKS